MSSHPGGREMTGLEVAIIGMSGRFPRARNVEEFWRNLREGVECITFFSDEELLASGVDPSALADPSFVGAGGVLDDVEMFDASFFGFNPREAEITDPQQRIFLECAWEALEDAGYDPRQFEGPIGVYAGVGMSSYLINIFPVIAGGGAGGVLPILNNDKDFLATRVSYKLDLEGPSLSVQTACSTSLVAVHLARQALLSGECDMALAGGVKVTVPHRSGYFYQEGSIHSPDGHCRAFDAGARGSVGGSGAGVVVLRRLEDALADGDEVRAVILGSAINNDGSLKVGYTAPSESGQFKVIRAAQMAAEIEPDSIGYVEGHGTGTALGDPVEVRALTKAFRASTDRKGYCALGSVKTNVGHLDAAAGVAGLIKATLAVSRGEIPPTLHYSRPNPQIDFASSPFYVNPELRPWQRPDGALRRAAVSSFGVGGTNAHLVIEEAPLPEADSDSAAAGEGAWEVLPVSARTPEALAAACSRLSEHLRGAGAGRRLADVAHTLQAGRRAFAHRAAVVCRSIEEAAEALSSAAPSQAGADGRAAGAGDGRRTAPAVWRGEAASARRPLIFVFPGQGVDLAGSARSLYESEKEFASRLDECAAALLAAERAAAQGGADGLNGVGAGAAVAPAEAEFDEMDVRAGLLAEPGEQSDRWQKLFTQTRRAQPALFAYEYALSHLLISWGLIPSAAVGHSLGEYAAACVGGHLTLAEAASLVVSRARLMQGAPEGAMLAVGLNADEAAERAAKGGLWVSAVNGERQSVVGGSEEAVERLRAELKAEGVGSQRLGVSRAFHTGLMAEAATKFEAEAGRLLGGGVENGDGAGRAGATHGGASNGAASNGASAATAVADAGGNNRANGQGVDRGAAGGAVPVVSGVSGGWMRGGEAREAGYWARQMREPVRFWEALRTAAGGPAEGGAWAAEPVVIEVGPGVALSRVAQSLAGGRRRQAAKAAGAGGVESASGGTGSTSGGAGAGTGLAASVVAVPRPGAGDEAVQARECAARLWSWGAGPEWERLSGGGEGRRRVSLPTYPFERQRYWIDREQPVGAAPEANQGAGAAGAGREFYAPSWKRSLPAGTGGAAPAAGPALVFDDGVVGPHLTSLLREKGFETYTVVEGERFARAGEDAYTLTPGEREQYRSLLGELASQGRLPRKVIHLWGREVDAEVAPRAEESFEGGQRRELYSLLYLLQALSEHQGETEVEVLYVTSGTQDVTGSEALRPEKSPAAGLSKVAAHELARVECRLVDAEPGRANADRLAARLAAELNDGASESSVAYRGPHRWVQTFEPLPSKEARAEEEVGAGRPKAGGLYLVAGRGGEVELELAEYLIRGAGARVALVTPSALPPREEWARGEGAGADSRLARALRRLAEASAPGGRLLTAVADLGDEAQLGRALLEIEGQAGRPDGVVYAAGYAPRRPRLSIAETGPEEFARYFRTSVLGLLTLEKVLGERPLDFRLLLSSDVSLVGAAGSAAYAASTACLDAFAQERGRSGASAWACVNLEDGREPEGRAAAGDNAGDSTSDSAGGDETGAARELFARLFDWLPAGQVLVSSRPPGARAGRRGGPREESVRPAQQAATAAHSRPEIGSEYVGPRNEVEQAVAALFGEFLGFGRVGVNDDLFELGGDSLMATRLVSRVQQDFEVELALERFFERPTVAGVALLIAEGQLEMVDADTLAGLMADLGQLSEEEMRSLLESESE